MYKIPIFRPSIDNIDDSHLKKAISGKQPELLEELESAVAKQLSAKYVVAVTNPASAIHLSLCALDLKRGDKIVCSTNAHPAIAGMIRHFDAEPIFVDVDPITYNIDLDKLKDILQENSSKKLRGVIVNFVAGQLLDLDKLYALAKEHDAFVIEDASGSFGIKQKNSFVGAKRATLSVLSFSPMEAKTSANTSLITTDSLELATRARLIRCHAIDKTQSASINYAFDITDAGFDYMPSALDLAYTLTELASVADRLQTQCAIASRYTEALANTPHITVPQTRFESACSAYIIKVDKNRDGFARSLAKLGIETWLHYSPLHMMSYYRNKYGLKITNHPVALNNYQHILSLPIYATLQSDELDYIIKSVKEIANARVW